MDSQNFNYSTRMIGMKITINHTRTTLILESIMPGHHLIKMYFAILLFPKSNQPWGFPQVEREEDNAFASTCSVLQCVAVCCSVLQCVAVCCSVLQRTMHSLQLVLSQCSLVGTVNIKKGTHRSR